MGTFFISTVCLPSLSGKNQLRLEVVNTCERIAFCSYFHIWSQHPLEMYM